MELKLCDEESVYKADYRAYCHNREKNNDKRHGVKVFEHLVGVAAHLEQRRSHARRESNAAACRNIGTGQHDTARDAESDGQLSRR